MSATTTKVYAGVNVSKGRLEVFVSLTGERFGVRNGNTRGSTSSSLGSTNRVPRWWCCRLPEASSGP